MEFKTESGLPDAITRREILDGDKRDQFDLDEVGSAYMAKGWFSDALDCFQRTGNEAKLDELKRVAVAQEPFLLERISQVHRVTADEWREAAKLAREGGRLLYALRCLEHAGDDEAAESLRAEVEAFRAEVTAPTAGRNARKAAAAEPVDADAPVNAPADAPAESK